MTDKLHDFLCSRSVGRYGVCAYEDILPLIDCGAANKLPENPRSVLAFLFPYYTGEHEGRNVARYAAVPDYHRVAGDILAGASALLAERTGAAFVPFVDNSPIRETEAARLAGLGDVGRNGLLISPVYGSYVFIGTIVTDLCMEPDTPGGSCPGCGACQESCPTAALKGSKLEPGLCRSHITQKTGELTSWESEQIRMGRLAWGCDICQDICPLNQGTPTTPIPEFTACQEPVLTEGNLERLHPDMPYNYRKKSVLKRNLIILK